MHAISIRRGALGAVALCASLLLFLVAPAPVAGKGGDLAATWWDEYESSITSGALQGYCWAGWAQLDDGHCYTVTEGEAVWPDQAAACAALGGQLASVASEEVNFAVYQLCGYDTCTGSITTPMPSGSSSGEVDDAQECADKANCYLGLRATVNTHKPDSYTAFTGTAAVNARSVVVP